VVSAELIVRSSIARDSAALLDRIATVRPRLLAIARSMNAPEPEDLVQSTMEIAIRRSAQLRDPDKLWPWLVAIQTRELFRWGRRLRLIVVHRESGPGTVELETFTDLREALAALPPRIRASVVLHHMADLSVADTARAMGTSENTVKSQLRVGLSRLKEALA
jgi:RNA polymerase sigma factor (sigma-70 family)